MIQTILGVFPHPDDEISAAGLFDRAIRKGIDVHLIYATCGEAGRIRNNKCKESGNLVDIRMKELHECCKKLGVTSLNLLGLKDNKSNTWIEENGYEKLYCLFEKINPDVIITFDKNGINGHPDHKEIHKLTNYAYNKYNKSQDKKLYYVTAFPESFIRKDMLFALLPKNLKNQLLCKFSTSDELVSFMIKLNKKELRKKIDLLKTHASQFPDNKGRYYNAPLFLYKRFARYECFFSEDFNKESKSVILPFLR